MFTPISEKYKMLPAGSRILAAVSGGADSVYLLRRLAEASARENWTLGVAHFNHRLRGEESGRDAVFTENLAAALGLPFYLGAAEAGAFAGRRPMGLEAAARELRYDFLLRTAAERGYDRVATAHTADDNAETVLLNLIRGSGMKGLCGVPPVRGAPGGAKIVRPILDVTEEEIRAWLRERDIPFVEDSSNEADDFARNRLRHGVTPVLRELNPRFAAHILRAAEFLRADEACLDGLAEAFLAENGPSAEKIQKLPSPVAARVFRIMAGRSLETPHVEALLRLCGSADPHAGIDLPGLRVSREYDALMFMRAAEGVGPYKSPHPPAFPATELKIDGETEIPELNLRVRALKNAHCPKINNSFNIFCFQSQKVCGKLTVRPRAAGDYIHLPWRNCTKSLKKLFSEARLTLSERARVPVLADERGILGVCGFGPDARALAAPGEPALTVEFLTEDGRAWKPGPTPT